MSDDIDFDDFEFDDFDETNINGDISPEPIPTDRSPAMKMGKTVLDRVIDYKSDDFIAKAILENSLPEGYALLYDGYDDIKDKGDSIFDSASDELKPAMKRARALVRAHEKLINDRAPGFVSKRLGAFANVEEDEVYQEPVEKTQQELDLETIAKANKQIFNLGRKRDTVVDNLADKREEHLSEISSKRFGANYTQFASMAKGIGKLTSYQDSVLVGFQQKTLELQHHQFFVAKESLNIQKAYSVEAINKLMAIQKNTGLPDAAKARLSDEWLSQTRTKVVSNLQKSVADKISDSFSEMRNRGGREFRQFASQLGSSGRGGPSSSEMLTYGASGEISNQAGSSIGGMLADRLNNNTAIGRTSDRIMDVYNNATRSALTGMRESSNSIIRGLADSNPNLGNTSARLLASRNTDDLRSTTKTIIEIIPGLLSRILKGVSTIATGTEQELITFDEEAGGFQTQSQIQRRVASRLDYALTDNVQPALASLLTYIDPSHALSLRARDDLLIQMYNDSENGTVFNPARYMKTENIQSTEASEIMTHLKDRFNIEESEDGNFSVNRSDADVDRNMIEGARSFSDLSAGTSSFGNYLTESNDNGTLNRLVDNGVLRHNEHSGRIELDTEERNRLLLRSLYDDSSALRRSRRDDATALLNPTTEEGAGIGARIRSSVNRVRGLTSDPVTPNVMSRDELLSVGNDTTIDAPPSLTSTVVNPNLANNTTAVTDVPSILVPPVRRTAPDPAQAESSARDNGSIFTEEVYNRFDRMINAHPAVNDELGASRHEQTVSTLERIVQSIETGTTGIREAVEAGLVMDVERGVAEASEASGRSASSYAGRALLRIRRLGINGTTNVRRFVTGAFGLIPGGRIASSVVSKIRGAIPAVGRTLLGLNRRGDRDLFSPDNPSRPILTLARLRAGDYFVKGNTSPMTAFEGVTDDIVDRNGNVVVPHADFGNLVTSEGNALGSRMRLAYRGIKLLAKVQFAPVFIAKAIYNHLSKKNLEMDVYVKGETDPRLRYALISQGKYVCGVTGKVISSWKDIRGTVRDLGGNVLISNDDYKDGLVDKNGKPLKGLFGKLMATAWKVAKFAVSRPSWMRNLDSRAFNAIRRNRNGEIVQTDVYVGNEPDPRLRGIDFDNGSYFDKSSGNVLHSYRDIKGAVQDADGNELLSLEESKGKLKNVNGEDLVTSVGKGGSLLKRIGKKIFGGIGAMVTAPFAAVGFLMGKISEAFNQRFSGSQSADEEKISLLSKILQHIKGAFPIQTDPSYALDVNGHRQGSIASMRANRRNAVNRQTGPAGANGTNGRAGGRLGASSVLGAVGGLGGRGRSGGTRTAGANGGVSSTVTDTAMGAAGGSLLSGAGRMAGSALARTGAMIGGSALLTSAGSMIGGVTAMGAATVLGGAVVAGAVGYGAWQGYKYLSRRTDLEPMEMYRFLQYGVPVDNKSAIVDIRMFEDKIEEVISVNKRGVPKMEMEMNDVWNDFGGMFGADTNNPNHKEAFTTWFSHRFLPIYVSHYTVAKAVDESIDLLDIDDEMDDAVKARYITLVQNTSKFRSNPWGIHSSPWPDIALGNNLEYAKGVSAVIINTSNRGLDVSAKNLSSVKAVEASLRPDGGFAMVMPGSVSQANAGSKLLGIGTDRILTQEAQSTGAIFAGARPQGGTMPNFMNTPPGASAGTGSYGPRVVTTGGDRFGNKVTMSASKNGKYYRKGKHDKYDSLIVKYMKKHMPYVDPRWLKAQLIQESGMKPTARSPVGALGIGQFMPRTWPEEMQRIGRSTRTPRTDPAASIEAAASYNNWHWKRLVKRGSKSYTETLKYVFAAYNAGLGSVDKAMRRVYGASRKGYNKGNWMAIRNRMPRPSETNHYVDRIFKNFQDMGGMKNAKTKKHNAFIAKKFDANRLSGNTNTIGTTVAMPGRGEVVDPNAVTGPTGVDTKTYAGPRNAYKRQKTARKGRSTAKTIYKSGALRRRYTGAYKKAKSGIPTIEFPMDKGAYLTSGFGKRSVKGGSKNHKGLDFGDRKRGSKSKIYAAADGTVIRATSKTNGYGPRVVYLKHKDGRSTRYAHLSSMKVRVGDKLRAGDQIGTMGAAHLHFEYRDNNASAMTNNARAFDPMPYLQADARKKVKREAKAIDVAIKQDAKPAKEAADATGDNIKVENGVVSNISAKAKKEKVIADKKAASVVTAKAPVVKPLKGGTATVGSPLTKAGAKDTKVKTAEKAKVATRRVVSADGLTFKNVPIVKPPIVNVKAPDMNGVVKGATKANALSATSVNIQGAILKELQILNGTNAKTTSEVFANAKKKENAIKNDKVNMGVAGQVNHSEVWSTANPPK